MAAHQERVDALQALVECRAPLTQCIAEVRGLPWDSDSELVQLGVVHVVSVLRRFQQGDLSARDVESWADALEGRDDVGYDSVVGELLFQLSDPTINGQLTADIAESLIKSYDGRPTRRRS